MQQGHVLGVSAFAQIEQRAGIGVVEMRPQFISIGIGGQAVEREAASAAAIDDIQRRFQVVEPVCFRVVQAHVEDAAGHGVVRPGRGRAAMLKAGAPVAREALPGGLHHRFRHVNTGVGKIAMVCSQECEIGAPAAAEVVHRKNFTGVDHAADLFETEDLALLAIPVHSTRCLAMLSELALVVVGHLADQIPGCIIHRAARLSAGLASK